MPGPREPGVMLKNLALSLADGAPWHQKTHEETQMPKNKSVQDTEYIIYHACKEFIVGSNTVISYGYPFRTGTLNIEFQFPIPGSGYTFEEVC